MMGNWNYGYGMGGSGIFFGWFFMIIFWVVVIWAIVAFIQWATKQGEGTVKHSAIHILEERYAKGEISKEEFEEKKSVLRK
jgi:putative membrane protein